MVQADAQAVPVVAVAELIVPAVENERNMVAVKPITTKAYQQKVKLQTTAKPDDVSYVSPEQLLEQARVLHGRNMKQLSDITELKRRQKAGTSMVRLQAEDFIVHALDRLVAATANGDQDSDGDDDDDGRYHSRGRIVHGASPAAEHEGTSPGPVAGDQQSGSEEPAQGLAFRRGAAPTDRYDDDTPMIVDVLGPSDDDEEDEEGDGSGPSTGPSAGVLDDDATAQPLSPSRSATAVAAAADNRRAEDLISQLRQFQRGSGPGPSYRGSLSNLPSETASRIGGDYSVRAGRQFQYGSPSTPQLREPVLRPSLLSDGPSSPVRGAARDAGAEPSVRFLRGSAASGGLPALGSGALEPSSRATMVGLGDKSVRGLRTASAACLERPSFLSVSVHNGGSPGAVVGGLSPVTPAGTVPRAGDKSVRTRRVSMLIDPTSMRGGYGIDSAEEGSPASAAAAVGSIRSSSVACLERPGALPSPDGGAAAGAPRGDRSVRSRRNSVLLDPSVRGGGIGCRTAPFGAAGEVAPLGFASTLPGLMCQPMSGNTVSLFKAITGAEPVGRGAPPPTDTVGPEASAKSMRASLAMQQLQQLQQLAAGGSVPMAAVNGGGAARLRNGGSSTQVEAVSTSAPSGTRLPKIHASSPGTALTPAGPSGYRRATADSPGATAPILAGRAAGGTSQTAPGGTRGAEGDDAGIVTKVKSLFSMLKRA